MSRYIEEETLIKAIDESGRRYGITTANQCNFKEIVRAMPAADVVEVVPCEKCKYYHKEKGGWCERHDFEFDVGDYCCHGERREE